MARGIVCVRRRQLFQTLGFRLAAGFVVLFALFTATLSCAAYWIIGASLRTNLQQAVLADIAAVQSGYQQEGIGEAQEVVNQLLAQSASHIDMPAQSYIALSSAAGGALAGNLIPTRPLFGDQQKVLSELGRVAARSAHAADPHGIQVLVRGVTLPDGSNLIVARDLSPVSTTRARIGRAFGWSAGLAMLMAVVGALLFGARFRRQTEAMSSTCDAIESGHFGGRIALRGTGDELDALAGAINAMLDRIQMLLDNLKQVSSDIAHDLRTPMARLRQRLEQARFDSNSTEQYSQAVTAAIGDVDSILSIFAALLRISQIEAGSRSGAFAPVSLSQLLTHLHSIYSAVAEDMGDTLTLDVQAGVMISGDAELLLQMFSNLLENALHHTPRGSRIDIALRVERGQAVACVADNGPGIAAGEREQVLRRFYRVASSRATAGNGLGLALVNAIASLHRAPLWLLDNAPGLRLEITFEPLARSA